MKLMCAQKLWDNVSVVDALACADMYNCPELKVALVLVVDEKIFRKMALTEGFMSLLLPPLPGPRRPRLLTCATGGGSRGEHGYLNGGGHGGR
jgi:hypothetical protein